MEQTTDRNPFKQIAPSLFKMDGWKNLLSGMGIVGRDKTRSIQAATTNLLVESELTDMYRGDGIAARVVNCLADDMTRAGWVVPQDKEGKLSRPMQHLNVKKQINLAIKWARLYGGCIVVADFNGGGAYEEPLKLQSTKNPTLRALRVYPAPRIELMESDINDDPDNPYFEEVEKFRIIKRTGGYFYVHASRCLVLKGVDFPDLVNGNAGNVEQRYWGMSALQGGYDYLKLLGALLQGIGVLGEEFSVGKYRLSNLEQLVAEGNFADLQKRMELIAVTKSITNSVFLGESEEYSRDNVSFTGIPDLVDRFKSVVAGAYGYPVTRLFGTSPGGMNATGESDLRNYYDHVESLQETDLTSIIHQLMLWINMSEKNPVNPDELSVEFNPVWVPTQQDEVNMRKTQADTDNVYMQAGVLQPTEVRKARFEGEYSYETTVDEMDAGYTPQKTLTPEESNLVDNKKTSKEGDDKTKTTMAATSKDGDK